MSVSIRPLLIPGVAMAMAVSPAVITPPALLAAPVSVAIPAVHVQDIELAGFTQDLYDALNGWAQFLVQVAQDFFFWNPPIAQAISGLYTTFEPVIATVVRLIDSVVTGPGDLLGTLTAFVSNFIGLPNLVPAGSVRAGAAQRTVRSAAAVGQAPRPAAADKPPRWRSPRADAPEVSAEADAPATRGEARRGALRGQRQLPSPAAGTAGRQAPKPAASRAAKAGRADAQATPRAARATR